MSRKIISLAQTDIGRQRQHNEDNFAWVQELWGKAALTLIGAIDGVGGYEGGAEAAALTKNTIENYLQNFRFGAPLELLHQAVITANNEIHQKRKDNPHLSRMSCVATVAILDADKEMMYLAHVGDSRGYILRNQTLLKITRDHSLVGMKEDSGYLTEEEAMHHPRRNEITKMLGEIELGAASNEPYIDLFEHSFLPNDIALFCSDGLSDLVTRAQMTAILSGGTSLEEKAQALIDQANELGGKDNITVALATYTAKKSDLKKLYKRAIEVTQGDGTEEPPNTPPPTKRKKKDWVIIAVATFLTGFLANWVGTKKILNLEQAVPPDTVFITRDTTLLDSMAFKDTLINTRDTLYRNSSRPNPSVH